MRLNDIIRRNAVFVQQGPPAASEAQGRLLVVAASCPGMAGMLEQALGLEPQGAVVVQLSGAWGGKEGEELLRSVALGVFVHGCDEILVVGANQAADCPPKRQQVAKAIKEAGLDGGSREAEQLLDLARGPNSSASGVSETVRLLRHSPVVPESVPVHGAILELDTGQLRLTDQDKTRVQQKIAKRAYRRDEAGANRSAKDFPLPDLPEIPLPELPELDLDALMAAAMETKDLAKPKPTKKASEYGQVQSGNFTAGPMNPDALRKGPSTMPQAMDLPEAQGSIAAPEDLSIKPSLDGVSFKVPEGAKVQDTGLGSYDHLMPGQPEPMQAQPSKMPKPPVKARSSRPAKPIKPPEPAARPKPRVEQERPQVTPLAPRPEPISIQSAPQAPLGERVLAFDEDTPAPSAGADTMVDIRGGYVSQEGVEFPLDADLQRALIKVTRFLGDEFTSSERDDIRSAIRRADQRGEDMGELIKLMVGPVLKLGKKRYAVINELLKIKEDLPRQTRRVAVALLDETIKGA